MVAAIVAVIGFVGFTLVQRRRRRQQGQPCRGGPGARPEAHADQARPPTKPADPKPALRQRHRGGAEGQGDGKLSVLDDKSWISAKSHNGKLLFDGTLLKGESKTFQDDERVDLVLGDAGAIELL